MLARLPSEAPPIMDFLLGVDPGFRMAAAPSDVSIWWPAVKPFVNGGTAATIGITIFNPIDVIKTRLQIAGGGSPFAMGARMVRTEGVASLYAGLSAQYLRAWTYQTARLGAYRSLVDMMQPAPGQATPLWQKALAGLTAGAVGAVIGNPAELSIIRMQADSTLPEAQRRNYKVPPQPVSLAPTRARALTPLCPSPFPPQGIGDALSRVVRAEGVLGLWTGSGPTIVRAMALNCGALASYDQAKEAIDGLVGKKDSRVGIAGASTISGIVGSVFSLPFDYVKTQIQRMKPDPLTGQLPFRSAWHCFTATLAEHGPLRFYAGARAARARPPARARLLTRRALSALPAARDRRDARARPHHVHDEDRADDHAHLGAARADLRLGKTVRLVSRHRERCGVPNPA